MGKILPLYWLSLEEPKPEAGNHRQHKISMDSSLEIVVRGGSRHFGNFMTSEMARGSTPENVLGQWSIFSPYERMMYGCKAQVSYVDT